MSRYKVRAQHIGAIGFFTQADHYRDYEMDSDESFEDFSGRIAAKGFLDPNSGRWIMPGGIIWIEKK